MICHLLSYCPFVVEPSEEKPAAKREMYGRLVGWMDDAEDTIHNAGRMSVASRITHDGKRKSRKFEDTQETE